MSFKLLPPFGEKTNILLEKIFHPQAPVSFGSANTGPFHQMVPLAPLVFLPKESSLATLFTGCRSLEKKQRSLSLMEIVSAGDDGLEAVQDTSILFMLYCPNR